MIQGLLKRETPEWLRQDFPIREILKDSLYYPASARDGDPVRYLGGFIHSFVYVDYSIEHDDVLASLHDEHHRFRGYNLMWCREISERELAPNGWKPIPPDLERDGNPKTRISWMKRPPYALWAVLERRPEFGEDHGPDRLSLLFICGDGVATFQALYHGNHCAPEVVAIIQPGLGFGGNWTDFRNQDRIFGRSVLQNPYGKPNYLLYGGWNHNHEYRPACWPDFDEEIDYWATPDGHIGLWRASWCETREELECPTEGARR